MASASFFKRPPVLLALALCSVGGVVTILGRLAGGPPAQQKRVTLSKETGTKAYPAFSPDGQRIAYSARNGANVEPFHIYVRAVTSDTPRQLTSGMGNDIGPVWSPDGTKIAFQRLEEGRTAYFVTGVDGGSEQQVVAFTAAVDEAQPPPAAAWTPDGRSLVVVQVSEKQPASLAAVPADGGGKPKRLTTPPEGSEGDSTPAVAPDGTALAFVRSTGPEGADIFLCDLTGKSPRRLTFDDKPIRGIAWTRDSRDLVYSAIRFGSAWRLYRVPAYGGAPREIPMAGRQAEDPAVAPAGNRLAYTESPTVSSIWRARLSDSQAAAEERALIRSNGRERFPVYSPDGQKIADVSDQTGTDEIWLSDADGHNRMELTRLNGPQIRRPQWSANGKSLLFDVNGDQGTDIYMIAATAAAKPRRLVMDASGGVLSPDGKRLYYQAHGQVWRASANGGTPEPVAKEFGSGPPVLSADGKTLYFRLRRAIWRVPVEGGEPQEAFVPDHDLFWSALQTAKNGIYYLEFERSSRGMVVSFYDFAAKKPVVVFRVRGGDSFSVSPDGQYILYPKVDQSETNLMLLENFR
jgi:Tol biopolymer transport system component